MHELWERLEIWFAANCPKDYFPDDYGPLHLPPGASAEDIYQAEKTKGFYKMAKKLKLEKTFRLHLPKDVRQSYLVHNGCDLWSFPWGNMLAVESIWEKWVMYFGGNEDLRKNYGMECYTLSTIGPMKKEVWNLHWIPLFDSGGPETILCVDLDPAVGGRVGQMICVGLESMEGRVVAGSFTELFANYVNDLEAGRYKWDDDEEAFVRTDGRRYPYFE